MSTAMRERRSMRELYGHHFEQPRRERFFLSSVGFALAFVAVRLLAHAIKDGIGPFQNIETGSLHVHHFVWGILVLLLAGYLWLAGFGTGQADGAQWLSRLTAFAYGAAAALTLDEFALWLNLKDVYWTEEGKRSIQVVMFFGALLSIVGWGGSFFRAAVGESWGRIRRH
jgi:hypothetical protein